VEYIFSGLKGRQGEHLASRRKDQRKREHGSKQPYETPQYTTTKTRRKANEKIPKAPQKLL
jgi:hypothetical protein